MFMTLVDGLAWFLLIALAVTVLMFALAGVGAVIGKIAVAVRDAGRSASSHPNAVD